MLCAWCVFQNSVTITSVTHCFYHHGTPPPSPHLRCGSAGCNSQFLELAMDVAAARSCGMGSTAISSTSSTPLPAVAEHPPSTTPLPLLLPCRQRRRGGGLGRLPARPQARRQAVAGFALLVALRPRQQRRPLHRPPRCRSRLLLLVLPLRRQRGRRRKTALLGAAIAAALEPPLCRSNSRYQHRLAKVLLLP